MAAEPTLEHIEAALLQTGGVVQPPSLLATGRTPTTGRLELRLRYASGHLLRVALVIDLAPGYPVWVHYDFHLQDAAGHCVWRYDNAPHYPELATFPHHKHVGPAETAVAAPQPTLRQLLAELAQAVRGP